MNEQVIMSKQCQLQESKEKLIQKVLTLSTSELAELLEFIEGGALYERCTEKLVSGQENG